MPAITTLKDYLRLMTQMRMQGWTHPEGHTYHGIEDYVLDRGVAFAAAALTPDEMGVVSRAAQNTMEMADCQFRPKECFGNAQLLELGDETGTLQYHEGYGRYYVDCLHGWVTINSKVVDLTWRRDPEVGHRFMSDPLENRIIGDFPEGMEYIGVRIPPDVFLDKLCCSILDDPRDNYPLLRTERINAPPPPLPFDLRRQLG